MKKILVFSTFFVLSIYSFGQFKQNIRGEVIDQASKVTLPGASISLYNGEKQAGTITNEKGLFVFENLSIGRYELIVSFLGYEPYVVKNINLESGKEKLLTIELTEKVENLDEVVVKAYNKGEVMNEMAAISARSFSVRETELYAGSLGDPSRMASNFAGVITANDSRNDIIIRGNSSLGLLWKLDGVSIPNPNHFGALGTTGGPVSMLNNNVLSNSDFFTGAFPAEYGNALSGVFDLKMRSGNNQKHEFVLQMGFGGFEVGAEGPISRKSGSSYIVNYRYSIPALMDKFGFIAAGGGVPKYQDLNMKFNLPTKNIGVFSVFALGGISSIEFQQSDDEGGNAYGTLTNTRTCNSSNMGVVGVSNRFFPDNKSNLFTSVAASFQGVNTQIDSTYDNRADKRFFGEGHKEQKISASTKYTRKINPKNTFKTGVTFETFAIDLRDSVDGSVYTPPLYHYVNSLNTQETGLNLVQAFGEWQHKFTSKLTLYTGLHFQQFLFNSTNAFDPRLSMSYQANKRAKFSIAYGMHSQLQPLYVYFVEDYDGDKNLYTQTNNGLDFTKAQHFVAGYDQLIGKELKLKIETYYQHISDIPVTQSATYFSMVNEGNTFNQSRVSNLVNDGLGQNYGVEFTLEKYLSNNYYFLLTNSLFDSKYKASDNVWRNTEFNTNYVLNALGGYQVALTKTMSIDMNLRVIWSGGKRNLFIDLEQSKIANETVYDDARAYSVRETDYFRFDGRVALKINGKKITQEWALDITNLTNHKNIYSSYYDTELKDIAYVYQQGLYPMVLYRINF
ncbi:MAG TPA: carboxypeptidase-like regulatory domain-containing protein [Prolixibacteraceae bacterium]|nr:carboxypeptidase-like regulatory domain-containing protein [Prolixibacteraceae bacterium]